ncbi:hypothetical protein DEO72_LG5g1042 [Vigna unguiculata]|uniref:Uncharacterized protein n=1 Tax=Vigna unguiculata TaxID=3917 RepID=A0A4D6LWW8_VIGUN|nr:hypothetical protein DEO72_LG5g1042 [Vigna unguiculata]
MVSCLNESSPPERELECEFGSVSASLAWARLGRLGKNVGSRHCSSCTAIQNTPNNNIHPSVNPSTRVCFLTIVKFVRALSYSTSLNCSGATVFTLVVSRSFAKPFPVARLEVLAQATQPRLGETCRNWFELAFELSLRRKAFVRARHSLAQAREARLREDE